jgi:hypothetical protein
MNNNVFPLTRDKELLRTKEYQTVVDVVKKMWDSEVIHRSTGYCFSVSDMVRTLLLHEGIHSKIVECQLTVINTDPPGFVMLGYDHHVKNKEVPTHVVCVTDTEIPMIIDLSIGYIQPDAVPFIVERASPNPNMKESIAEIKFDHATWHYTHKRDQYFPKFHQESIIDRIATDRKVKREIGWLKLLIGVVLAVSALSAVRGTYDFYQKYYVDNTFGPQTVSREDLLEELQKLEQKLQNINLNK